MCDIGRFDYHWIEGDDRLHKPLVRNEAGLQQPADWHEALAKTADRIGANGGTAGVRLLVSAHASLEELFLIGRLGGAFGVPEDGVTIGWGAREKPQPANTKFRIPPVDAPNVTGAADLGFPVARGADGAGDPSGLRRRIESGAVKTLYVFDPGPAGSLGDVSWIIEARRSGTLPLLIVQGVLMTDLARAADIVLAGACSFEKDAAYVNGEGRLQAAARAFNAPGDALEDWQIFVNLGAALGTTFGYTSSAHVRGDLAKALAGNARYEGLTSLAFARPVTARHWLQASNPSERWKWDVMFQDLPPVKFEGRPDPTSIPGNFIRVQKVE
jgi:predicted molibdopterin-dependent oxidoreductase YjgC